MKNFVVILLILLGFCTTNNFAALKLTYPNGDEKFLIGSDNKTLILGLDCGSIISLNIENLTPVEEDVKLSDGFRIVNVENKETYLNCEISSANEFDSFDYYIYDLNGKLLTQGTLGTVVQGSNRITINYTKTMLYPAILLVKSRLNNTYQSELFY